MQDPSQDDTIQGYQFTSIYFTTEVLTGPNYGWSGELVHSEGVEVLLIGRISVSLIEVHTSQESFSV